MQDNDNPDTQKKTTGYVPFDRLLKAREVAQVLGVSESRAYRLMASGVLPVIRIGKAVRVSERQFERWIAHQSSFTLPENEPDSTPLPSLNRFELSVLEARLGLLRELPAKKGRPVPIEKVAGLLGVYREKVRDTESIALKKLSRTGDYSEPDANAGAGHIAALNRIAAAYGSARLTAGSYPTLKQIKESLDQETKGVKSVQFNTQNSAAETDAESVFVKRGADGQIDSVAFRVEGRELAPPSGYTLETMTPDELKRILG